MSKLQVDFSDKASKIISFFKIRNDLKTKNEAVNMIVELAGEEQ